MGAALVEELPRCRAQPKGDIIMQYSAAQITNRKRTGFNDFRGNPICEGDIIKHMPTGVKYTVEWDAALARWIARDRGSRHPMTGASTRFFGVVGNIHD